MSAFSPTLVNYHAMRENVDQPARRHTRSTDSVNRASSGFIGGTMMILRHRLTRSNA